MILNMIIGNSLQGGTTDDEEMILKAIYMICKEFIDLIDDPADIHEVDGYTIGMARLYIKRYEDDHKEVDYGKETT